MTARMSRVVAALLALLIFAAGAAAGIAVDRVWFGAGDAADGKRRRRPTPDELLARFSEQLDLTDEQAAAIGVILHEVQDETEAIYRRTRPEVTAARERAQARILELLTPEQDVKYEKMLARMKERSERRRARGEGRRSDRPRERENEQRGVAQ